VKCMKLSSVRSWRTKGLDREMPCYTTLTYGPTVREKNLKTSLFNCICVATCLNQTTPSSVNDKCKHTRKDVLTFLLM